MSDYSGRLKYVGSEPLRILVLQSDSIQYRIQNINDIDLNTYLNQDVILQAVESKDEMKIANAQHSQEYRLLFVHSIKIKN